MLWQNKPSHAGRVPRVTDFYRKSRVFRSERKAGAAATGGGGVRIVDLESGADQLGRKVDFRPAHEFQAHLIHKDPCAVALNDDVIVILRVLKVELVGKARTAPTFDGDAKVVLAGLFRQNRINAPGSIL